MNSSNVYPDNLQCPACGNSAEFVIEISQKRLIDTRLNGDNYLKNTENPKWSKNSYCACCNCGRFGVINDFVSLQELLKQSLSIRIATSETVGKTYWYERRSNEFYCAEYVITDETKDKVHENEFTISKETLNKNSPRRISIIEQPKAVSDLLITLKTVSNMYADSTYYSGLHEVS